MGRLAVLKPSLQSLAPRIGYGPGDEKGFDRERSRLLPWRGWYKTARWRRLRLEVFRRDLFTCQAPGCGRLEGDTARLVADHVKAHRGDAARFWDADNLQTLCKPCHDGMKQRAELKARR